jgi:hypothetical protein
MTQAIIQSGFIVNGQVFTTKAEAMDFLRRPQILAALGAVKGATPELAQFVLDNQEAVEQAFETGLIKRVTKQERKLLVDGLAALLALSSNDSKAIKFVRDNAEQLAATFRWPTVERMDDATKALQARNSLLSIMPVETAEWILGNKDALLAAFEAGKVKREVSEKAAAGLQAYREKLAAEKAAAAKAAETAGEAPV